MPSDPGSLSLPLTADGRKRECWWRRGGNGFGGGGGASGEVAFIRILPTWADFLRLTANHVRLCQVMYPAASRGHQRRVERRGGGPPSISRFSQPPSGEPLTPKHFDSWDGDIGSMFGLSLPCPDCHCSHVCVCKRRQRQRKRRYDTLESNHKPFFFFVWSFLQIFHANTDPAEVVLNRVPQPVLARFVRIRPQTWRNGIALRFELYGCQITGMPART